MSSETAPRLRLRGVSRSFGAVRAVSGVDLDVRAGSVHALLGENGAGKSTLMNLVYGVHRADAGTVEVDGRPLSVARPTDALAAGIAMVHQHHRLVPSFTVAESLALATPSTGRRSGLDLRAASRRVRELSDRLGLDVDPASRIEDLSLTGRQRVEILTAVHRDARLLVLDEPTAVLAPSEVGPLFALLRRMAAEGRSVVLITHRMKEVFAVCDTVSVMRRGELVATLTAADTSQAEVLGLVVTSPVDELPSAEPGVTGDVALRVDGLRTSSSPGSTGLQGLSFEVRAGEVLGLAGVEGNGQRDLVEVLTGTGIADGVVEVAGAPVTGRPARGAMAVVPEDRHGQGLVLDLSSAENLVLDDLATYSRAGILDRKAIRAHADALISDYGVVTASAQAPVRSMSGGNQQKIVLARALSSRPSVLVVSQATRGLDPGAAAAVLMRIREAAVQGTAVVFIGSDLDEVVEVSDRVAVLFAGSVAGHSSDARAEHSRLAGWMTGATDGPEQTPSVINPEGTAE